MKLEKSAISLDAFVLKIIFRGDKNHIYKTGPSINFVNKNSMITSMKKDLLNIVLLLAFSISIYSVGMSQITFEKQYGSSESERAGW